MDSQQTPKQKRPILQVNGLSMSYGAARILEGIDLHVLEGEIFGLIGISGSGKTTLLELLIGFLEPEAGDVRYRASLLDPSGARLESDRAGSEDYLSIFGDRESAKRLFGFATQSPSFYDQLTVRENLLYFGALYDLPHMLLKKNLMTVLDVVGLLPAQDAVAGTLSSGMKKRLDIACALIHNPKILILDEPTADLDILARRLLWSLVKRINANGTTIILASHLLDEIETLCDSIAVLHDRHIISKGGLDGLRGLYSEQEEVHLQTERHDYRHYAAMLGSQKDRSQNDLKVTRIGLQGNTLVVRSAEAKETLHYLLHIAERLGDKIIDLSMSKPSLNEVFERITRGAKGKEGMTGKEIAAKAEMAGKAAPEQDEGR